ncbi:MAG TPA: PspC domain-containing protein [Acidimicrobiia bacterium]|nr:PspC domain-containing protein [Acidimicrobiia bacterium]
MSPADFAHRFQLHRRRQPRVLAGVAGGLADRLGVDDGYVRAAFVTLSTLWGLGVVAYGLIWWLTYEMEDDRTARVTDFRQRVGLALAFLAGLWILAQNGAVPQPGTTAVVAAVSFGVAALWDRSETPSIARIIIPGRSGGVSVFRLLIGLALVGGGLSLLFASVGAFAQFGVTLLAVVVTGVGLLIAFGPLILRLGEELTRERRERIRQEERAEVAAHLHDSVLQTLALMQRTDDPRRMATLARAQERELRAWLYGRAPIDSAHHLSAALEAAAARVERDHNVVVEVVTVGDANLDDRTRAMVAAATEAMVNAAKHSGEPWVSVYLEIEGERAEVWVTDQGKGFDQGEVLEDRRGITDSIVGRMLRHGGVAEVHSSPGEGTEVHLTLPGVTATGRES